MTSRPFSKINNNRCYARTYNLPSRGLLTTVIVSDIKFHPMEQASNSIRKWSLIPNSVLLLHQRAHAAWQVGIVAHRV